MRNIENIQDIVNYILRVIDSFMINFKNYDYQNDFP